MWVVMRKNSCFSVIDFSDIFKNCWKLSTIVLHQGYSICHRKSPLKFTDILRYCVEIDLK